MRKHLLLSLIISLCAMSTWAADVSVTEKFTLYSESSTNITGQPTDVYNGDICKWEVKANRRSGDVITLDATTSMRCWWLTKTNDGYVKSTNFEGGFKKVSFRAAKFGASNKEANNTLILSVSVGNELAVQRCTIPQDLVKENGGQDFEFSFEPTSGQLEINNISNMGGTDECRILVGDITITPYILYRPHCKFIKLGLKQRGFKNYLIDNTEGGNISYSSENTSIATVDADGVVTPVAAGSTTISASWNGYSTTYSLTIIDREDDIVVENFSKIDLAEKQINSRTFWEGDLYQWAVRYVRRNWGDTLVNESPRQLGTFFPRTAYIETNENIEGGVKNLRFEACQWGASTNNILVKAYYYYNSAWQVANTYDKTPSAGQEYVFDKEIDDGTNGNSKLKISNESTTGDKEARIVIPNLQITPWLLYTTKSVTWDRSVDENASYTNSDIINNTSGDPVVYAISANTLGATIDENTGAVKDATKGGDVTVTATWGDVSTSYNLHIKANTTASFAEPIINKGVADAAFDYSVTKTVGSPAAEYASTNENVAEVASNGKVTIKGVGQTTITATITGNDDYSSAEASYILRVTDNSANALVETFENVSQEELTNDTIPWSGKLFDWRVFQVRRNSTTDTIRISEQGTWIRIHDAKRGFMQSEDVVEGGIKHISFYWRQWATESDQTLRLAVLVGEKPAEATPIEKMERSCESGDASALHEKYLFGASNVMRSNQKLVIRNESFTGEAYAESSTPAGNSVSRLIIDDIHITPWLLYTRKSVSIAVDGDPYTNTALINTTAGETGTLSYRSLNETVATVNGSGVVTPHAIGVTTIEAKFDWGGGNYVTTTYQLNVVSALTWTETYENFPSRGMQQSRCEDPGVYFKWYYNLARSKNSTDAHDYISGTTRGVWMSHYCDSEHNRNKASNNACYLESTPEGGIKHVYFQWKQNQESEDNDTLRVTIEVDEIEKHRDSVIAASTYRTNLQNVDIDLLAKTNAKFTIRNRSTTKRNKPDNIGRITVGPITITPYLFYLEREKSIMTGETYINPMIDNTDGEGTVTYSLISPSTAGAATINAKTGEVTTLTPGTVTVKALWSEGAYTTYTLHIVDVILEDEANNSATIEAKDGQTVGVLLKDRTIRTGGYNTLCLPFAVSEETLQATLPGAKAYEFTNAYLSENNLDIRFDKRTALEAGKPYLVTVPADVANPVFESVTINKSTANNTKMSENEDMWFKGSFNKETMSDNGLYVVANSLYRVRNIQPEEDRTIGACRAYFDTSAPIAAPVRMRIVAGTNTATDVESIQCSDASVQKVLRDGHLYILRDGRMYNAQGLLIKE